MRRIWIPERMYRTFPLAAIAAGIFFSFIVQNNWPGLLLSFGLIGYGSLIAGLRAVAN